ncbi:MAG: hypothetical protein VB859_00920, partial [Planctomycetaceae bacterium]
MKPTYTLSRFARLAFTLALLVAPLILFAQDSVSVGERLAPPSEPVPPGDEEKILSGPETTGRQPDNERQAVETPREAPAKAPAKATAEALSGLTTAPVEDFSEVNRRARSADPDLSDRQSPFLKSTPVRQKVIRRRRPGFLMMPIRKPKAIVPTQRKVIDPTEIRKKTREALSKISPILHGSAPLTKSDMASSPIVLEQLQEIYRRNGLEMPAMTLKQLNLPSENIADESPAPGSAPFPDAPAVSTLISGSVVEQNSVAEPGFVQISDAQATPPTPAEEFMDELVGALAESPSDAATVAEVGLESRDEPNNDEIAENAG